MNQDKSLLIEQRERSHKSLKSEGDSKQTREISPSLLFHISYYSNALGRLDNKNKLEKKSEEYRDFVRNNVKKVLNEIDSYTPFVKKVVVFDINVENTDIHEIDFRKYPTIDVRINEYSFHDEHPFRLTTKHRHSMMKEIENFDWFGYAEDDTLVTAETMKYIVENLDSFYTKKNNVFTIPRMVCNTQGEYFYSDIRKPSPQNGEYVIPENRFGACWVYSKGIMKDWIKSKSFLNFNYPNANGGIRVTMGTGYLEKNAYIPIDVKNKKPLIESVHLQYSWEYYFIHPKGYHTLKQDDLIATKTKTTSPQNLVSASTAEQDHMFGLILVGCIILVIFGALLLFLIYSEGKR